MEPSQACTDRSPYEALQQSEARFQKLLAPVPGIIYQFLRRPDGSVCFPFVSGGCRRVFEFEPEVLQQDAMPLIECIHPEDRQEFDRAVTASAITLQPWQWQGRFILPSGIKWVDGYSQPEAQHDGSILWDGYLIDITASKQLEIELQQAKTELENRVEERNQELSDRKAIEATLRESEERLRLFMQHTPTTIAMFDRDVRYVMASQRWVDTYKLDSLEAILGRSHYEVFPEIPDEWKQIHQRCLAGAVDKCDETIFLRADGSKQWIRWEVLPWYNSAGEIGGIIMFSEDITDRKVAQLALQASEARFRSLTEATSQIIWDAKAEGVFATEQPQWSAFTGQTFDELKGWGWLNAVHSDDQPHISKVWSAAVANRTPCEVEYRLRRYDGEYRYTNVRAVPILNSDGSVREWIGVHTDITDRKQAEAELRRSQQRLSLLVQQTPLAVIEWDLELKVKDWNPAAAEIFGYSREEALGCSLEFLVPEYAKPNVAEVTAALLALQGGTSSVNDNVTKDGRIVTCEWYNNPLVDADGTLVGLATLALDVSDRKAAEAALQQKEAQYRNIFESVKDGISIFDLDTGNLLACNPAYSRMHGYTAEEFVQLPASSYIHQDSLHLFPDFIETVQAGKQFFCEAKNIRKDGTAFDVEVTGIPHVYNNKPCLLAVVRDVSDRKRMEAQLKQQEAFLRSVYDGVEYVIFAIDVLENREFRMAGWNATTERAFGMTSEETANKTLQELFGVVEGNAICQKYIRCLEAGVSTTEEERVMAKGKSEWWLTTCTPLRDDTDRVYRIIGTATNISDRKQAESALRQSEAQLRQKATDLENTLKELRHTQSQLVQSEKMSSLGQLVAGVAHEINNPVNFIYGNLTHASDYVQDLLGLIELYQQHYPNPAIAIEQEIEAIDLEFLTEDLPKLFASMRVGADRIQKIVLSLRNFSRMDEAELKQVNIHEGIDSTLMILQNRIKSKPEHPGIEVVKEYGDLPAVECYAGQLNQVFMNVISNAIDALEQRDKGRSLWEIKTCASQIRIWTGRVGGDRVAIRIEDNGVGMTESVRSRIFDPFFTTKPVGKGTGLGLPISYQVVTERHAGQLWCESQVGQGTTFVIEFPVHQTKPSKPISKF